MRIIGLFIVLLLIAALSSAVFAGQTIEKGTQGTKPEHECDYMPMPDFIQLVRDVTFSHDSWRVLP
jgi:hypothetical protein